MDFSPKDAPIFPIRLTKNGTGYGFCPAKAGWDQDVMRLYRLLVLSAETKTLLYQGGIADQPGWFVDLLSWFVSRYDEYKFYSRAKSILGDGKGTKSAGNPGNAERKNFGGRR